MLHVGWAGVPGQLARKGASEVRGWPGVRKTNRDSWVWLEKAKAREEQPSDYHDRRRRTLTVSTAGLVENVFLENHLLLHGGERIIIIL